MASTEHARRFVYRVTVNLARSYLRKQSRVRPGPVPDRALRDQDGDTTDRLAIAAALASLSPRQRACVVLIDFVGYDTRSVAALLRTRASTVRVHLSRARSALRAALTDVTDREDSP
jgi:RNA polymerase sigma factor (sigma-70 family)